jgi:outer membrane protein W
VAATGNKKKKNTLKIKSSFKFLVKVGVEESIVNAPLVSLDTKNTNNEKSEVRFKQLIRDL